MNFNGISNLSELRDGASLDEIKKVEINLQTPLPGDYKLLLGYTNGLLLDNGLSIYSTDDIAERNDTFQIADYCEEFLLIGDDSGGRGFLISRGSSGESKVYRSGLGDLDPSDFVIIEDTLQIWIDKGLQI